MTSRPERAWRKRILRAALSLLLGAATTIAVAWGFTLSWSPSDLKSISSTEHQDKA